MKRVLRKLFPSLFPISEYVTGSAEGLPCMLKCVAVVNGKRVDLERQPLFLGYKPLVMGICDAPELIQFIPESKQVTFEFLNIVSGEKVASLELRVDKIVPIENQLLVLLVGISGSHTFETRLERLAFRINQRLTKKSPANIDLTRVEYEMLKVAYSVPREIRMVTVRNELGANTFPIDLFGIAGLHHLVLSLRHSKKSFEQIAEAKLIHIRTMSGKYAPFAHFMGRGHSMSWHKAVLPPDQIGTEEFGFAKVIFDYGIHRILILHRISRMIEDSSEKLVHVHRSYANWHKRQGFPLKEIPH